MSGTYLHIERTLAAGGVLATVFESFAHLQGAPKCVRVCVCVCVRLRVCRRCGDRLLQCLSAAASSSTP